MLGIGRAAAVTEEQEFVAVTEGGDNGIDGLDNDIDTVPQESLFGADALVKRARDRFFHELNRR
jgi:hypothetical protein